MARRCKTRHIKGERERGKEREKERAGIPSYTTQVNGGCRGAAAATTAVKIHATHE